jgi:hypothetical protein
VRGARGEAYVVEVPFWLGVGVVVSQSLCVSVYIDYGNVRVGEVGKGVVWLCWWRWRVVKERSTDAVMQELRRAGGAEDDPSRTSSPPCLGCSPLDITLTLCIKHVQETRDVHRTI